MHQAELEKQNPEQSKHLASRGRWWRCRYRGHAACEAFENRSNAPIILKDCIVSCAENDVAIFSPRFATRGALLSRSDGPIHECVQRHACVDASEVTAL